MRTGIKKMALKVIKSGVSRLPDGMYLMEGKALEEIEVLREPEGWFQRRLNQSRIGFIVMNFKRGCIRTAIVVVRVQGKLVCVDGQHRLAAAIKAGLPIYVQLETSTKKKASWNFCLINHEAKRVALSHRLLVDYDKYAETVRDLAGDFSANVQQVHNLILGLCPSEGGRYPTAVDRTWKVATYILSEWNDDRRWKLKSSYFSKLGTLKVIGEMVRKHPTTKLETMVYRLRRGVDYSANSPFAKAYGAAGGCQKNMRERIYEAIGLMPNRNPKLSVK